MNKKLLIIAISIALIGGTSVVANSVYADPQNPTAVEASCKNNADKKDWCASQDEPAPNQDQNNTSGEGDDSENNTSTEGSENTTTDGDTTTLDENNNQDSNITNNNNTEPEDTIPPPLDEDNNQTNTQDSSGTEPEDTTPPPIDEDNNETNPQDGSGTEPEDTTPPPLDEDNNETNTQDGSGTEPEDTTPPPIDEDNNETNTQDSSGTDNNSTGPEDTILPITEELFIKAQEAGVFTSVEATIQWLATNGISPETLTEEQRNTLPIDWDSPQLPPVITIDENENEVTPTEGEDEAIESSDETIEGEDETIESEDEAIETEDEIIESEANAQPLQPEDVEEPTYSPVVTDEEEQAIQTQLEAVDEVIVVDETGNETLVPIEETEVVGEVVIPPASDEEGANASINGELFNVQVELGVAEATTPDKEPVILTTVTGLEMNAATTQPGTKVNTKNLITLQLNKAGNFILRIPHLKVGDLVVNLILRALTDKLDVYQVEEVTIAPKDVFNNDDSAAVETDDNTVPATESAGE
jgi:hypothetical protein